jgi:O-antigen/teichoic acid export membrane protein
MQAPRLLITPVLTALGRPRDPLAGLIAELLFMLGVTWWLGMPSLPWAVAIWVASECVLAQVSSWMLKRATGYSFFDQFRGILKPGFASLVMAAAVMETRLQLPAGLGPISRLAVLLPVGAIVFAGAISLLDRGLVSDFLGFVRSAFEKRWKHTETP